MVTNFKPLINRIKIKLLHDLAEWGAYVWHEATTGSTYIKFPHWGLGSIRIGDHKGKSKYTYRWIVRVDKNQHHYSVNGKTKTYGSNCLTKLVTQFKAEAKGRDIKPGDKQTWEEYKGLPPAKWKKQQKKQKKKFKQYTPVMEGVVQCNNCGAHANTEQNVIHHKTCKSGEAQKWEDHYAAANKEVLQYDKDVANGLYDN